MYFDNGCVDFKFREGLVIFPQIPGPATLPGNVLKLKREVVEEEEEEGAASATAVIGLV